MTDINHPEFPFGTFICQDCGATGPRKSRQGRAPLRCEACKAKKKTAEAAPRIAELHRRFGRKPKTQEAIDAHLDDEANQAIQEMQDIAEVEEAAEQAREEEAAADNEAATSPYVTTGSSNSTVDFRMKVDDEPSWLDDQEAQNLLRDKKLAEILDKPVDELVSDPEIDHMLNEPDEPEVTYTLDPPPEARPVHLCAAPNCGIEDPPHAGAFCPAHWQQIGLEERNVLLGVPVGSETYTMAVRRALAKLG